MDELSEEVKCYELATLSTQSIFRLLSMLMQTLLDLVRLRDRDKARSQQPAVMQRIVLCP